MDNDQMMKHRREGWEAAINFMGGSAFPYKELNDDGTYLFQNTGMSLRDWYAGQALTFLGPALAESFDMAVPKEFKGNYPGFVAMKAYELADAMIAERNATKEKQR